RSTRNAYCLYNYCMDGKKTLTLKILDKINSNSKKYSLFKNGDNILLAISGGPDSIMMLDFFAKHSKKRNINLCICHINHMLRGKSSDMDEAFVKKLGQKYDIETFNKKIDVQLLAKKKKISIEHAARLARYNFLIQTAKKKNCSIIATAHHSDDNVETVLLNLIRGTNPKGLLGIPIKRVLWKSGHKKIYAIRPLMAITRGEILAYIKAHKLLSRKDKTNDDEKYTRNWIRKTLLPLIEKKQPQFRGHIIEMSVKLNKELSKEN
ncbi:MAG: tRNA lysidine(34) synthetase TilS, partial [Elusimicrobiales bacterium]|nr:tRNA lysidine(34) synthetase TilS [Elusimicrobiales bacterium]